MPKIPSPHCTIHSTPIVYPSISILTVVLNQAKHLISDHIELKLTLIISIAETVLSM